MRKKRKNNIENIEIWQESPSRFWFKVKDGSFVYYSQRPYPSYKNALQAAKEVLTYCPKKVNTSSIRLWTGKLL